MATLTDREDGDGARGEAADDGGGAQPAGPATRVRGQAATFEAHMLPVRKRPLSGIWRTKEDLDRVKEDGTELN